MTIIKLKDNAIKNCKDLTVDKVANCGDMMGASECVVAKDVTFENGKLIATIEK